MTCECSDPGCPVHAGASTCSNADETTMYRIDMQDDSGTRMCRSCADDAHESGVFSEEIDPPADDDADSDEPGEDDITTTDHRTFYQYGRKVLQLDERARVWYAYGREFNQYGYRLDITKDDDHCAALRAYMDRVQFWPDVWVISDHGNAHRIELTEGK